MSERQVLKREVAKRKVIRDEEVNVVIKIAEETPERGIQSETSEKISVEEREVPTDQAAPSEDIRRPRTLEISVIQPTFQGVKEVRANVSAALSSIEISKISKLKHVHPLHYQALSPTPVELGSVVAEWKILETSASKAVRSVRERALEPEFEEPKEIVTAEVNSTLPKVGRTAQYLLAFVSVPNVVFVRPSEIRTKVIDTFCYARSTEASPTESLGVEEFKDPIEYAFGSAGFKLLSERPIIILAVKPEEGKNDYIEFLKRILREVYRTRARGLPAPAHISTRFEDVKLDVKAGRSVYVIDLDGIELEKNDERYLVDRIKEIYSQNFGFIVLYGSESSIRRAKYLWMPDIRGFSKLPKFLEVKIEDRNALFKLANVFWGVAEDTAPDKQVNLDEYVVKLEDDFYSKIEEIASDVSSALIVEPSKEDEEGLNGESVVHYGIKAFVVNYLWKFEKVPLEDIQTEFELGDAIIDVFVRHPKHGDVAIEVETLYGTAIPPLKLRKRIESRLKKGLKTWIVVPNPQFVIYFKEISALRTFYRKRHRDLVEFWTLDVRSQRLVPFKDIAKRLKLS